MYFAACYVRADIFFPVRTRGKRRTCSLAEFLCDVLRDVVVDTLPILHAYARNIHRRVCVCFRAYTGRRKKKKKRVQLQADHFMFSTAVGSLYF